MSRCFAFFLILLTTLTTSAADLKDTLASGVIAESNHKLDDAIAAYKQIVTQHDHDRQIAATALLRLSESYRKQGNTAEAERWANKLRAEFPNFSQSQTLSTLGGSTPSTAPRSVDAETRAKIDDLRKLLQQSPDLVNARASNGATFLHTAATESDIPTAKFLLENGANIEVSHSRLATTPLQAAVESGHKAMAEFLISQGADVNARSGHGATTLSLAIGRGFTHLVKLLVDSGASLEALSETPRFNGMPTTALARAAAEKHHQIAELLVEAGANANPTNGLPPLHVAVSPTSELLLEKGADPNLLDPEGVSPLGFTLYWNLTHLIPIDSLEVLLRHGANPNFIYPAKHHGAGLSLLHTAIRYQKDPWISLLLAHGADVNLRSKPAGLTPLMYAASFRNERAVRILLSAKADVQAQDEMGATALHHLFGKPGDDGRLPNTEEPFSADLLRLLLDAKADINAATASGETPLDWARDTRPHYNPARQRELWTLINLLVEAGAKHGAPKNIPQAATPIRTTPIPSRIPRGGGPQAADPQPVLGVLSTTNAPGNLPPAAIRSLSKIEDLRRIIRQSPDLINSRNANGTTYLHQAASESDIETAKFLLENGASVDSRDSAEGTPLHAAVHHGHQAMAEFLLSKGADVNAINKHDQTPLGISITRQYPRLINSLIKAKADLNLPFTIQGTPKRLPITHAASLNQQDAVEALIAAGANLNPTNATPPLHVAYSPVLELLLEKGADPNALNREGVSPLAAQIRTGGAVERSAVLLKHGANPNFIFPLNGPYPGLSLLHVAVQEKNLALCEILLKHKADVNIRSKPHDFTPLIHAANISFGPAIPLLVKAGADVNARAANGATALHHVFGIGGEGGGFGGAFVQPAIAGERVLRPLDRPADTVRSLLAAKIDINAATTAGETALDWANKSRAYYQPGRNDDLQAAIDLLVESGAKPGKPQTKAEPANPNPPPRGSAPQATE